MAKQTPNPSPKSFFDASGSNKNQGPMTDKKEHNFIMNGNYHVPDRMETFPKTNTFPKKWDLSSFSKDSK